MSTGCAVAVAQPQWFCWQSKPQAERLVCENLARQGFCHFLPFDLDQRPLFPGYGFVRFALSDHWGPVMHTYGLRTLLGACDGHLPIPVPQEVMDRVLRAPMARQIAPRVSVGDRVRLLDGAFADYEGLCRMEARKRVMVLLTIMGGEREVWISRESCERVA